MRSKRETVVCEVMCNGSYEVEVMLVAGNNVIFREFLESRFAQALNTSIVLIFSIAIYSITVQSEGLLLCLLVS